jgi:hypothetical protein
MHLAILNNKHCSVAEAATIIGCTEGRVRQLLRSQEMRGIKVNERAWLVEVKDGLYLHRSVARLDKGIPNPKERPTLPCPWSMRFTVQILENNAIKESTVRQLLVDGGIAIGLGTYRGTFGKFVVDFWK